MISFIAKTLFGLLVSFSLIIAGYYLGKSNFDFGISLILATVKDFLNDFKIFIEVTYFVIASLLIPIAYYQYRNEKIKEKKGAVEYAHKLFRMYIEEILLKERKFSQTYLKDLSLESGEDKINEFNDMLNRLDAFAAAFNHGIADLEAGKRMMGKAYCEQINSYLPAIKRISGNDYKEGLENLFALFDKWKETSG